MRSLVIVALVACVALAGCSDQFPKVVDGSPARLMDELADLDIRELPGEPGSTADAAGGVMPVFRTKRGADRIEWIVTSNSQVAMTMTAMFEPVDGGKRTRITPYIERGPAPDSQVSPAFTDSGVTMGLFQMALQRELDEMIAGGWGPECEDLRDRLLYGEPGDEMAATNVGPGAIVAVNKLHKDLMAAGCNPDMAPGTGGEFREVSSEMSDGSGWADDPAASDPDADGGWGAGS
ncbi:hypothetical protein [Qipengyuania sp. JC766]|uniref:hypothetical protein n=1 Tax=Qipengyuania sp. JC766 TaxID=3232139 RepID=UPI003458FC8C